MGEIIMQVEIYFGDLSEEKQNELLKTLGINCAKDENWDVFPITILEFDDEVLKEEKYS